VAVDIKKQVRGSEVGEVLTCEEVAVGESVKAGRREQQPTRGRDDEVATQVPSVKKGCRTRLFRPLSLTGAMTD